jgi:hypothetical protein
MKPKTPATGSHSDLDKFVDDLDDLSILGSAMRIEEESASGVTSSGAATTFFGLDSFQSKDSRSRSRLDLRDLATDLQEANVSESLSTLEKDLDSPPLVPCTSKPAELGLPTCVPRTIATYQNEQSAVVEKFLGAMKKNSAHNASPSSNVEKSSERS